MSVKVDGRVYENVSLKFDEEEFPVLVTYREDGEPSDRIYTRLGHFDEDVRNFIADTSAGVIQNIQLWRLHGEIK